MVTLSATMTPGRKQHHQTGNLSLLGNISLVMNLCMKNTHFPLTNSLIISFSRSQPTNRMTGGSESQSMAAEASTTSSPHVNSSISGPDDDSLVEFRASSSDQQKPPENEDKKRF